MNCSATRRKDRGKLLFIVVQCFLVPSIVSAAAWSHFQYHLKTTPIRLLDEPRVVRPRHDVPQMITDDQLAFVLERLEPRLEKKQAKINHIDHALRFWGKHVEFHNDESMDGPTMHQILMDDRVFRSTWGSDARPLLARRNGKLEVRTQEGPASSSHTDHTLATLLEVQTSLDETLVVRNGSARLRDLMNASTRRFDLNQKEPEWSTLSLVLCSSGKPCWISAAGQELTMDRIAKQLMGRSLSEGCCYGGHRLYTLAVMLRVNEHSSFFSDEMRNCVESHLSRATEQLIATQHVDGYWDASWAGPRSMESDPLLPLGRRLTATGHALEWWAMVPRELHPPREVLVRAAQWLVREIETMETEAIQENYTFLSHVGRALALWRGVFPGEFYPVKKKEIAL